MKKTLTTAGLVLCAAAAFAQGAPVGQAKVAVIDSNRIFTESLMGKGYVSQAEGLEAEIKSVQTKKQAEFERRAAEIKTLRDELEKQGSVISAEARERKEQDLTKKIREAQAFKEDSEQELGKMQEKARGKWGTMQKEFLTKIQPLIEQVAKDRGVDILLDIQAAMPINKAFDISSDVIVKSDDAFKASGGKPPAPAPKPSGK